MLVNMVKCNGCGKVEDRDHGLTGWWQLQDFEPKVVTPVPLDKPWHFCGVVCLVNFVTDMIAPRPICRQCGLPRLRLTPDEAIHDETKHPFHPLPARRL